MKHLLQNAAADVDFDLDEMSDEDILDTDLGLGSYGDDDEDGEFEGLGYTGLGKMRRRGRKSRRSRGRRRGRKARAARRSRRRRSRGSRKVRRARRRKSSGRRRHRRIRRHARAAAKKGGRRRRRRSRSRKSAAKTVVQVAPVAGLGAGKRRRRRRKASAAAPKRRRARRHRRSRSRGTAGLGVMGRALGKLANTVALQGLGKAGRKRRKSRRRKSRKGSRRARVAHRRRRRSGRKAHRRVRRARVHHRRKGSRRRARRMSGLGGLFRGLGSIGNMGAGLADAEVASSMYVVGPFQYLASMPGLEAIGGVTLAGIIQPLVRQGIFAKFLPTQLADPGMTGMLTRAASVLTSTVAIWELGRLMGSGNVAKFGAFYTLGRGIEEGLTKPYILKNLNQYVPGLTGYGLGQVRIQDTQELRDLGYLSQARIPDQDELRDIGQRIVTEEELLGDVGADDEAGAEAESNVF